MSRSLSTQSSQKTSVHDRTVEHNVPEVELLFVESEKLQERGAFKEANEVLLKAANLGHTGAQVTLGNNFSSGQGVTKSEDKAAYWYKRAYREGDESGAFNLAIDKLRDHNTRGAVFWFNRARRMGSGEATLELAKVYLGMRQGKSKAISLLEMTQQMKPSEISEDAREEASHLLSEASYTQ